MKLFLIFSVLLYASVPQLYAANTPAAARPNIVFIFSDDHSIQTSGDVSAPTILSDNGTTPKIKVTGPAGNGVTRRFVHLKLTRP